MPASKGNQGKTVMRRYISPDYIIPPKNIIIMYTLFEIDANKTPITLNYIRTYLSTSQSLESSGK